MSGLFDICLPCCAMIPVHRVGAYKFDPKNDCPSCGKLMTRRFLRDDANDQE